MNKSELIRSVASNTRHTQKEVEEIIDEAIGEIIDLTTVMNERVIWRIRASLPWETRNGKSKNKRESYYKREKNIQIRCVKDAE